jgi:hypothetical protein
MVLSAVTKIAEKGELITVAGCKTKVYEACHIFGKPWFCEVGRKHCSVITIVIYYKL